MAAPKESDRAILRACRIQKILKGHALDGLTLTQLHKALGDLSGSPSTVLRALYAMQKEDVVTNLDNGAWALSVALLQIAEATHNEIYRKTTRIAELSQRIQAGAR